MNILLGVTGSVAATLTNKLIEELKNVGNLQICLTESAKHFIDKDELARSTIIWSDHNEWTEWQELGDRIRHIELRKWADVMVIAPLSANTLAKIVNGLCDNLLTSVVRAWEFNKMPSTVAKPLIVAPSMNKMMYQHPITFSQLKTLREWGIRIVPPQIKVLACGDEGIGAMADIQEIVEAVKLVKEI